MNTAEMGRGRKECLLVLEVAGVLSRKQTKPEAHESRSTDRSQRYS